MRLAGYVSIQCNQLGMCQNRGARQNVWFSFRSFEATQNQLPSDWWFGLVIWWAVSLYPLQEPRVQLPQTIQFRSPIRGYQTPRGYPPKTHRHPFPRDRGKQNRETLRLAFQQVAPESVRLLWWPGALLLQLAGALKGTRE